MKKAVKLFKLAADEEVWSDIQNNVAWFLILDTWVCKQDLKRMI